MAVITIGPGATDRGTGAGATATSVDQNVAADGTGTIDTVEIWAFAEDITTCEVAMFEEISENILTTRSNALLGTVTFGSKQEFTGLTLSVEIGDYIGIHGLAGNLEADSFGVGFWSKSGDQIPCTGVVFSNIDDYTLSLYGTGETPVVVPTVTTQAASSVEATTATGNGNITNTGGENCDMRGIVWDLASHGAPGNVAPGASGYANDVPETDSFGTGAFTRNLIGLPTGDVIYARAYAHNSAGYAYGGEVSFLTKPAAPTSVAATDGDHTDKVVVTWVKATGATGYQVYRDGAPLGWLGDVATYDDVGADAPVVTPGAASASDGTSPVHVTLSLAGESVANGTTHTYKVRARNATGESADSATNTGYRGHGALTYQWQRSAGDSDAAYGILGGATTDPYNDTTAPANGSGRWYYCEVSATGAVTQDSTHDRGYRWIGGETAHMGAKLMAENLM